MMFGKRTEVPFNPTLEELASEFNKCFSPLKSGKAEI